MSIITANDLNQFTNFGAPGLYGTPAVQGAIAGAMNPTAAYMQNMGGQMNGAQNGQAAIPGVNTGFGANGFGMNMDTARLALGGLQTIGNLWAAWEANKLAKQQFNFQKDVTETNLANQIKTYNTALEDRSYARAHTEGRTQDDARAYIDQHQLKKQGG